MSTPGSILTDKEFMACERISGRTLRRRIEAGELVRCKTGRRLANGKKEYGIPVWCLSDGGQRKLLRRTPKRVREIMAALLEATTDGVRGPVPEFPERSLDVSRRAEARGDLDT